jgi:hypothetical protein
MQPSAWPAPIPEAIYDYAPRIRIWLHARLLESRLLGPLALKNSLAGEHISVAGRERIEADIITGPTRPLEGRAFSAATRTASTGAQLVA